MHRMRRKLAGGIIFLLMLCTVLMSCRTNFDESAEPSVTGTPAPKSENPSTDSNLVDHVGGLGISVKELSIYSICSNHKDIESVTALVASEEITPELIVDKVVESMEDASFQVKVLSVKTDADTVIVDFDSDAPPVSGVAKATETAILDAIAQSLLDNLEDYHKIVYHVEGKAYVSENRAYAENYVYIEK